MRERRTDAQPARSDHIVTDNAAVGSILPVTEDRELGRLLMECGSLVERLGQLAPGLREAVQAIGRGGLPHFGFDNAVVDACQTAAELQRTTQNLSVILGRHRAVDAQAKRDHALAITEQVLRLIPSPEGDDAEDPAADDDLVAALEKIHREAAMLQGAIAGALPAELPVETSALGAGEHPLAYLVALVQGADTFSRRRYQELWTMVEQGFGRPVALAAGGGGLQIAEAVPSDVSAPAAAVRPPVDLERAVVSVLEDPLEMDVPVIQPPQSDPVETAVLGGTTAPDISPLGITRAPDTRGAEGAAATAEPAKDGTEQQAERHALAQPDPAAADRRSASPAPAGGSGSPDEVTGSDRASDPRISMLNQERPKADDNLVVIAPVPPVIRAEVAGRSYPMPSREPASPSRGRARRVEEASLSDAAARWMGEVTAAIDAPETPPSADSLPPEHWVWLLVATEHEAAAAYLAAALESRTVASVPIPPPALLRALILSRHLRDGEGALAKQLETELLRLVDDSFERDEEDWSETLRLLRTAAALPTALLAPSYVTVLALHDARDFAGLAHFRALCLAAAEYCEEFVNTGSRLDWLALRSARSSQEIEADRARLEQEERNWLFAAKSRNLVAQSATDALQVWISPRGVIGRLLDRAHSATADELAIIRQEARQLTKDSRIRELIDDAAEEAGWREQIFGRGVKQLSDAMRTATGFALQWVNLREEREIDELSERTFRDLAPRLPGVIEELAAELENCRGSGQEGVPAPRESALISCQRAVAHVAVLLDPARPFPDGEASLEHILGADLLKLPELPLDEHLEPGAAPDAVEQILQLPAYLARDWTTAFAARAAFGDYDATQRIIEVLEAQRQPTVDRDLLEALRVVHNTRLRAGREALRRRLDVTRVTLGDRAMDRSLTSEESDSIGAQLDALEEAAQSVLRIGPLSRQLEQLEALLATRLEEALQHRKEQLAVALRTRQDQFTDVVERQVRRALEQRNVRLFDEYMTLILNGHTLPPPEDARNAFDEFFPMVARDLDSYLERSSTLTNVASRLGRQFNVGGTGPSQLTKEQASEAAELLRAWSTVKSAKQIVRSDLRAIVGGLGFDFRDGEVTGGHRGSWAWAEAHTEPLQDRGRCPVAAYGSRAGGNYRFLCVWHEPTEVDILGLLASQPTTAAPPVIAFYFGRLKEQQRRALARLCRERRRTILVIDDILMLFLCMQPGRAARLPALFACTLPFTYLEPYVMETSEAPPELFYGRAEELPRLTAMDGPCLVYGGRQMGKTALLRAAERAFHAPEDEQLATWIDVKYDPRFGNGRSLDAFWQGLVAEFRRRGVLTPPLRGASASEDARSTFLDGVRNWLAERADRRILLLLDEADPLLALDGRHGFETVGAFRALMDDTGRRQFKVVFAGLRDVRRTAHQPNQPLTGYGGVPLRIGPLLDLTGDETRAARDLAGEPLRALGYRFEHPEDVFTLLAETNYYPGLIHLYGNRLLRHIRDRFDARTVPPYRLSERQLTIPQLRHDLQEELRDRFRRTLEIDARYHLIALLLALEIGFGQPSELEQGLSDTDLRTLAHYYHPELFEHDTEDGFRAILDELVDLSVLRKAEVGHYTLRGTNVVALLGDKRDLETRLLEEASWLVTDEGEYAPATYRAPLPGPSPHRRSPLSLRQEEELRTPGVSILFGTRAAGLDDLSVALWQLRPDGGTKRLPVGVGIDVLLGHLDVAIASGESLLVLVPADCGWDEDWVEATLSRWSEPGVTEADVRVIFVADPPAAWRISECSAAGWAHWRARGLTIYSLHPWHNAALRQWLAASAFGTQVERSWRRIGAATGNWPYLLEYFRARVGEGSHRWEECLEEIETTPGGGAMSPGPGEIAAQLGLGEGGPLPVLRLLVGRSRTPQELAEELSGDVAVVERTLMWAEWLCLVLPVGAGSLALEPVTARVLAPGP